MEGLLSLDYYWSLLVPSAHSSLWQAAASVITYDNNHPPLFFMMMNLWLRWFGVSLWSLRSLPALWGVVAVAGSYYLGRRVAGTKAGLWAAGLMAVSPYGIYLSQESRHYGFAVAIALFSLIQWVALIQGDRSKYRWLAWIVLNGLGVWVHYFYGFCVLSQWGWSAIWLWQRRFNAGQRASWLDSAWLDWVGAMGLTILLYLPLLPLFLSNAQSGESDLLSRVDWLSRTMPWWQTILLPWIQSLAAGVFMLILLPVEEVSAWVSIPSALLMLGVFGLMLWQGILGWRSVTHVDSSRTDLYPVLNRVLVRYSLGVFLIILAIVYGLGKDLTVAPRYFFPLYPAVTVIAAAALARRPQWVLAVAIAAGIVSQSVIAYDLALFKPNLPEQVGQRLATGAEPILVLMSPQQPDNQARALSYILAVPRKTNMLVGFSKPAPSSEVWQPENIDTPANKPQTLWLVEIHRDRPFPSRVNLPQQACMPVGELIETKGAQQQQYRCE